ncbi:hypothetical protein FHX74_001511 [Friedmanniella endophytica]|uniref:Uncharacterized protein n=2 Tax=Microlunatus kandeliicorticis TaxID=1759536 RepID=A0A7W3P5F1_9ACTN|nr:hypothetical protein [Microlunatus kandeliicorticis]
MSQPIAIPSRAGDDPGDDPRVRGRMHRTAERYAGGIRESLAELAQLGLVDQAVAHIRVHGSAPLFKLYLINDAELFFGFYPVMRHDVTVNGETIPTFDPMGKDTALFHHTATTDPDALGSQYVAEAARWFGSIWDTIAKPATL